MSPAKFWMANPEACRWLSLEHPLAISKSMSAAWHELHATLIRLGVPLYTLESGKTPGVLAMASAGVLAEDVFIPGQWPSRFQNDRGFFDRSFRSRKYTVQNLENVFPFQGERDLVVSGEDSYWGTQNRREAEASELLSDVLEGDILTLPLTAPQGSHLENCFAPWGDTALAVLPHLDPAAVQILGENFKEVMEVPVEEARQGACALFFWENHAILPAGCPVVEKILKSKKVQVHVLEWKAFQGMGLGPKSFMLSEGLFHRVKGPEKFRSASAE